MAITYKLEDVAALSK